MEGAVIRPFSEKKLTEMTREEAIKTVEALPVHVGGQTTEDKKTIRAIVKEFGVEGVNLRGGCPNCWSDAVLVLRNFFGISGGDTDGDGQQDNPGKWLYLRKEAMLWRGQIMDSTTPSAVVDEFVKYHPQFYRLAKDEEAGS